LSAIIPQAPPNLARCNMSSAEIHTPAKTGQQLSPDHREIKNVWRLLDVGDNSVIELRAIGSQPPITKIYRISQFKGVDALKAAFERDAIKLNNDGYNIYTVMNPIRPDFAGTAAKDTDIQYRKWLLIDIDKASPEKRPSTQDELDAARDLAKEIAIYLSPQGWGDPDLVVMSGNGYHLYYDLGQMPNTEETNKLIQASLRELAHAFDASCVKVDQVVYNASRITKVVGTVARKGTFTEQNPYRIARITSL
jgi:hypothetical protein